MQDKAGKEFWDSSYHKDKNEVCYPTLNILHLHQMELARVLKENLPSQKNFNFMELGCGSSIWLPYVYKEFGYNIAGIDYSEAGVHGASENLKRVGCLSANLIQEDLFALTDDKYSHLNNSFDAIFSLGLLEHFEDPGPVINIGKKLLKKGGIWIAWMPNSAGLLFKKMSSYSGGVVRDRHYIFSLDDMVKYHEKEQLTIKKAYYTGFMAINMIGLAKKENKIYKYLDFLLKAVRMPIYGLLYPFNIQSKNLCPWMVVVAQK